MTLRAALSVLTLSGFTMASASGCFGSSSATPPEDGGLDDSGMDATLDQAAPEAAGPDATGLESGAVDASPDVAEASSPDAVSDAPSAPVDSGDAAPVPDGAPCSPTDAGLPETRCNGVCVDTSSDMANCGACNNACAIPASPATVTCALGGCLVTLGAGQDFPYGIALDSTSVYWTTGAVGNDIVGTVPKAGGPATTLASGLVSPGAIAVNSHGAYWTDLGGLSGGYYTEVVVESVPLDGGTPAILANVTASGGAGDIRLDSNNVYFSAYEYSNGQVASAPLAGLDGGTATTLASGQTDTFAMTIDGTSAYFTNAWATGSVVSVPLSGAGTATTLASGQYSPAGIAVDSTSVYWTTYGGCAPDAGACGVVQKTALDGGDATVLASGVVTPMAMAVDSTYVYWTDWNGGNGSCSSGCPGLVMRAPIGGGAPTTLAAGQENPSYIAVDPSGIYWTNTGPNGTVMKLVLP